MKYNTNYFLGLIAKSIKDMQATNDRQLLGYLRLCNKTLNDEQAARVKHLITL